MVERKGRGGRRASGKLSLRQRIKLRSRYDRSDKKRMLRAFWLDQRRRKTVFVERLPFCNPRSTWPYPNAPDAEYLIKFTQSFIPGSPLYKIVESTLMEYEDAFREKMLVAARDVVMALLSNYVDELVREVAPLDVLDEINPLEKDEQWLRDRIQWLMEFGSIPTWWSSYCNIDSPPWTQSAQRQLNAYLRDCFLKMNCAIHTYKPGNTPGRVDKVTRIGQDEAIQLIIKCAENVFDRLYNLKTEKTYLYIRPEKMYEKLCVAIGVNIYEKLCDMVAVKKRAGEITAKLLNSIRLSGHVPKRYERFFPDLREPKRGPKKEERDKYLPLCQHERDTCLT